MASPKSWIWLKTAYHSVTPVIEVFLSEKLMKSSEILGEAMH
jgi:hypothetical protein